MPYCVYILKSEQNGRYYVGQTADLATRIKMHNRGRIKSTKGYCPWTLVHYESFASRKKAVKREREIKSYKNRVYIESLLR
ncbi:MAG: GIY-YIG nuclease family protein [bacterium]